VITAKENTCLIRLSWIISSELHLRCSDEEPLNEDLSQEPGPLQEGTDTEESQPDFTYDYGCVQYDNNGNLTRKTSKTGGPLTTYEYDAENKLVRVVTNGTTINYRYDGIGRRVEKEVNDGATIKVTRYIFDNEDILLELACSGPIQINFQPAKIHRWNFSRDWGWVSLCQST
jgi:YD repeat-containing protein